MLQIREATKSSLDISQAVGETESMEPKPLDLQGFLGRWVRASLFGWLLGLVLVIVLSLLGDLLGGAAPSGLQFMVGVGVGLGVGYMQSRSLSAWLERPNRWVLASTLGMGGLFVVRDVVALAGYEAPYSLPVYILVGAALTGLWQWSLLRRASDRSGWWVAASLLGWLVPACCIALGDSNAIGPVGQVASLGAIFFGGAILGASSGPVLVWILRPVP